MSTLTYPATITHDTLADAAQIQSNYAAVQTVVNGNLEMGTNVKAGTPVALTGSALSTGSSLNGARADHGHTVQGVESLSADPVTGLNDGRLYFNTSTHKVRQYLSGVWTTVTNVSATELVNHAPQHGPAGDDIVSFPACYVQKTSNTSTATATQVTIPWAATDLVDTDSMHDPVTNNSRITFKHAGLYRIWANVAWAANGAGDRWAWIQLNGTGSVLAGSHTPGPAAGDNPYNSPSASYLAAVNDYIELIVYQNSGGTLNVLGTGQALVIGSRTAPCYFGAEWVGSGV